MSTYSHNKIEKKWQKIWAAKKLYQADLEAPDPYYLLVELTYTSGDLHMGHWFAWTAPDIYARFKRMQGANVLFPVGGFDAFGLPAENAAIKHGIHPKDWTYKNIETMRKQFVKMGPSFDWDREVITSDPDYYRWTQWLFLQMYKKGLAYKAKVWSNWCPECKTVLANEHVENGCCWRHTSTPVEQKEVEQWLFKITDYAEKLLWPKKPKVDWPQAAVEGQNNWIGKSEGLKIKFQVLDSDFELEVFTTRPDTIFGATFIVLAPEHPLIEKISTPDRKDKVIKYRSESLTKLERVRLEKAKDKTGVFTGAYAVNPLSKEPIPIWVADFVLANYGTGAIMGVPAHDERDFAFARKNKLPIRKVIDFTEEIHAVVIKESVNESFIAYAEKNNWYWMDYEGWGYGLVLSSKDKEKYIRILQENLKPGPWYVHSDGGLKAVVFKSKHFLLPEQNSEARKYAQQVAVPDEQIDWDNRDNYMFCYAKEGVIVNSNEYNGLSSKDALKKISKYLLEHHLGEKSVQYHLRDWTISRQRYWGAPIPVIYCDKCGTVPVPEDDLPVVLPEKVDYTPTGKPPLATAQEWVKVSCPKCGGWAKRDVETMDTYVDSSWYFFRYPTPNFKEGIFDKEVINKWMPIKVYFGGPEHILGHTLYARFITKVLNDLGYIDFDEFALKRFHHGVILGSDGFRMSKSRGNVVNPDLQVEKFGADSVRVYIAFLGPHDKGGAWKTEGIEGSYRFLNRVWRLFNKGNISVTADVRDKLTSVMNVTLKKVSEEIEKLQTNTALASIMEYTNFLQGVASGYQKSQPKSGRPLDQNIKEQNAKVELKSDSVWNNALKTLALLLAPFAPHMMEEIWVNIMGQKFSIHRTLWPKYDPNAIVQNTTIIAVQVNGKLRGTLEVSNQSAKVKSEIVELAKHNVRIAKWLKNSDIKKEVFVPGKLVNFVV